MLKSFLIYLFLSNIVLGSVSYAALTNSEDDAAADAAQSSTSYNDDCLTNSLEKSVYCRGSRAIRNVINNLNKSEKPIIILRGLEIVRSRDANATEEDANAATENANTVDESFLGRFSEYLRTHELNIKFSDLLAEESERFLARDLERNDGKTHSDSNAGYIEESRKKDKGQGVLMAMALMFGKVMAVMGLGGIGALAMKALGIAMAALMMAGMVGLKSMSEKGGGHESSHSVQYLTPEHHRRRRRSVQFAKQLYASKQLKKSKNPMEVVYRGWQFENRKNSEKKLKI